MTSKSKNKSRSPRIFLSYSQADAETANIISKKLREAGLKIVNLGDWVLFSGDSIKNRIEKTIAVSDYFVFLLSPHAIDSSSVQHEMSLALSRELKTRAITLIPVLIEDCKIPSWLANHLYIDFRSDLDTGIQRLIEQLTIAPDIDFSKLDWKVFENLVADLLITLGFSIKQKESHSFGQTFDFLASIKSKDSFYVQKKKGSLKDSFFEPKDEYWLIEVKLYKKERVSIDVLKQMISYLLAKTDQPYKGLVVTNGQLTSVAREFLKNTTAKTKRELRVIDGAELRALLLQFPNITKRYFPKDVMK